MRVDVTPDVVDVIPGHGATVVVTVTNTETIIGGYSLRVLGADPGWVVLSEDTLSLFPDEARAVTVQVTPPEGLVAGSRRLAVQVRELTEPYASTVSDIDLVVPAVPKTAMNVDPVVVNAGKQGTFSLLVENTGNTDMRGWLSGDDEESAVAFVFEPDAVSLAPGEHAVVEMRARAKRPFFGSPAVRSLEVFLEDTPPVAGAAPRGVADGDEADATDGAGGESTDSDPKALAGATFIQKPVMGRGSLGLVGLMVAATVFAVIISLALGKLVAQSTADRNLALQVAQAQDDVNAGSGSSGVAGTVRLLTTGAGEPNITVSLFAASDLADAVASTATKKDGSYTLGSLAAGKYKLYFRGANYQPVWYPGATSADDGAVIQLEPGKQLSNQNITIGGVPAKISGTVSGDDVGAATLYLESGGAAATSTPTGTTQNTATGAPLNPQSAPSGTSAPTAPAAPGAGAIVQQVPIGSDGTFTLSNVPSPSVYQLVVVKKGYATAVQRVDVGAGENRKNIQMSLLKGDGLISGTVIGGGRALGGVTVVATSGSSTASTVSVNGSGSFALRTLATPATYTVVASSPGFGSQTLSLTLTAAQKLTGVDITLSRTTGTVTGVVTKAPDGFTPVPLPTVGAGPGGGGAVDGLGGVGVTLTDGRTTRQTVTTSSGEALGTWSLRGLPVPGSYTATFTRSDLETQTIALSIDAAGTVTTGTGGDGTGGIAVAMRSSTGIVAGYISQRGNTACAGGRLGEAQVSLTSGSSSYAVTTASVGDCGRYVFDQIPPGSYTLTASTSSGTTPQSQSITVVAGGALAPSLADIKLDKPASITGLVTCCGGTGTGPAKNWTVFVYKRDGYPRLVYRTGLTRDTSVQGDNDPTNDAGHYLVGDIDAGQYLVAVSPTSSPDDALQTQRVTVLPSTQATRNFAVTR